MTTIPSVPANLAKVRSTEFLLTDSHEIHRQKLARITLDSMVQFVGLLDAKGTVLEINPVALDAVGVSLSEVEGRPFWTTFWWQVSEEVISTLRESIRRASLGEFVRWEAEIYGRADGRETIIIDASLMPVKDEQGRVVFITAEGRDITEKRAHEREIARQREELAKLDELRARIAASLESSLTRSRNASLLREEAQILELLNKVGIAVAAELNLERAVQVVTDTATELTGAAFGAFFYNLLDERGESYMLYTLSGVSREAFSKFPMPRNTAIFAPTFKGVSIVRSDDIMKDSRYGRSAPHYGMPKGHLPVRSYLSVPVISRSGEVLGGLFFGHPEPGIFTDRSERLITGIAAQAAIAIDNARLFQAAEREVAERRRAEAALQALNATLEQRVIEEVRKRSKAEDQLRQVQKMEAVGQLTGGIAHDFNNMLAIVIGGLNVLQRKLAKGETDVDRFVEGAINAAKRAATLTHRLLAFSRQQPLAPEPLNPNRMVAGMTDLLGRTLGEPVSIETVLGAGLWQVRADPGQLENAILNLSVNARDAMPDGGKLTIETSNAFVDDAFAREYAITTGQYVLLAVADTGIGMSADVIAKAFDPFFTTKGVGKGTGLGLSQVYGFVRQSGGHVKIYSEMGIGTTVKIYLPRYYGESASAAPEMKRSTLQRGLLTEIIMVVEDDERVRAVSVEALKELGYGVIEAEGPKHALRMLEEGQAISLLFTDVVMPEMSGRELSDRAREKMPGLRVLFTTGYTRNAIVHNGTLDAGTNLLTKPFSVDELAMKIRQILDR